jgi:hypothetical protein
MGATWYALIRDRGGRLLRGERRLRDERDDDVHLEPNQFRRKSRKFFEVSMPGAILDRDAQQPSQEAESDAEDERPPVHHLKRGPFTVILGRAVRSHPTLLVLSNYG